MEQDVFPARDGRDPVEWLQADFTGLFRGNLLSERG